MKTSKSCRTKTVCCRLCRSSMHSTKSHLKRFNKPLALKSIKRHFWANNQYIRHSNSGYFFICSFLDPSVDTRSDRAKYKTDQLFLYVKSYYSFVHECQKLWMRIIRRFNLLEGTRIGREDSMPIPANRRGTDERKIEIIYENRYYMAYFDFMFNCMDDWKRKAREINYLGAKSYPLSL